MLSLLAFINRKSFYSKLIFTFVMFLLVTLPRFNRNSLVVERKMYDAAYFKAYVEHFRGEVPSAPIRPASNWRLLIPFVSSFMPFDPLTSINLMNLLALGLGYLFLWQSLKTLSIDDNLCWLGIWLAILSFPTFYYTTIGYIDPGAYCFVSLIIYLSLKEKYWLLFLAVILGALTKETTLIALPFPIIRLLINKNLKSTLLACFLIFTYIMTNVLVRKFAFVSQGEAHPIFWEFSSYAMMNNFDRLNSYLAPLLSFGIPGLIALYYWRKSPSTRVIEQWLKWSILGSLVLVMILFCLTWMTTFADGRIIWLAQIPLLLFGMYQIQHEVKSNVIR